MTLFKKNSAGVVATAWHEYGDRFLMHCIAEFQWLRSSKPAIINAQRSQEHLEQWKLVNKTGWPGSGHLEVRHVWWPYSLSHMPPSPPYP